MNYPIRRDTHQAARLIEANTRQHTVDGYTSHHMVAAAHEATIRTLCAELNVLAGKGQTPQAGCTHAEMTLGDATVLVEFEVEPASGDGWNEPRYERSVQAIGVLINGAWCDAQDVVPDAVLERWQEQFLADEADESAAAEIAAYEARREDARWAA